MTDWNKYYRRARLYTNGVGISPYMEEVVPNQLTLRRNLLPFFNRKQPGDNRTAFKEVNIVPPGQVRSRAVKRLLASKISRQKVDEKVFARVMFRAMKKAIVDAWDPQRPHIIQHSSGWDSRLISIALRALRKEKGDDWLGDTIFVETGGEAAGFLAVMKAEGWDLDRCYVYQQGVPPREHYRSCFDFSLAWAKLNGYCAYPMNLNFDPMRWLVDTGVIDENGRAPQFVTGYGANEIGDWVVRRGGFRKYADFIYYHGLSHFPLFGGEDCWIHPFYHLGYIRTWIANSGGRQGNYRQAVVSRIAPRVARVKPVSKQWKQKVGYQAISLDILAQCEKDYRNSWLGREVFPNVKGRSDINYHPWWGYWSLASFCEYLLSEGYEIGVE